MNTPDRKDDFKRVPDPLFAALAAWLKEPIPNSIPMKGTSRARPAAPEVTGPLRKGEQTVKAAEAATGETRSQAPALLPPQTPSIKPISWKWISAYLSLIAGASGFALIEDYLHNQYLQAWVADHQFSALIAGFFLVVTITGIIQTLRRRIP